MIDTYMQEDGVKLRNGIDVNSIMRDMMPIILEGALDEELDKELVIPSMIIETRKQTVVETATLRKPCTPAMAI